MLLGTSCTRCTVASTIRSSFGSEKCIIPVECKCIIGRILHKIDVIMKMDKGRMR